MYVFKEFKRYTNRWNNTKTTFKLQGFNAKKNSWSQTGPTNNEITEMKVGNFQFKDPYLILPFKLLRQGMTSTGYWREIELSRRSAYIGDQYLIPRFTMQKFRFRRISFNFYLKLITVLFLSFRLFVFSQNSISK